MKNIKIEIKYIINNFDSFIGKKVYCSGRISSVRKMRDSIFADLFAKDSIIQIKISRLKNNENIYPGDLIEVFGVCSYTQKKEKTIFIYKINFINKWQANKPFKHLNNSNYHPLKSFVLYKYKNIYLANLIRNNIRKFFYQNDFFEVQTPILSNKYNGGRSFPVISSYLNEKIGFNRTTMEERMQALIGSGFENIFQIGSIFRSGEEKTFLEGYSIKLDFEECKKLIQDMLSFVVLGLIEQGLDKNNKIAIALINKKWVNIDFYNGAAKYLNIKNSLKKFNTQLISELKELKIINNKNISPESLADKIANEVFKKINKSVIINGFPSWSSPLYKIDKKFSYKLKRSRFYIPGQDGGFEIGSQENDFKRFEHNINEQNKIWNLSEDDERLMDSDLKDIISAGLPDMIGFALSPDRILKIWVDDPTIDSYE